MNPVEKVATSPEVNKAALFSLRALCLDGRRFPGAGLFRGVRSKSPRQQGLTLLEVMIAVALLGIAVGSIFYAFSMANVAGVTSRNRVSASELGRTLMDLVHEGGAYVTSNSNKGGNSLLLRNVDDLTGAVPSIVRNYQAYQSATRNDYTYGRLLGRVNATPASTLNFVTQPADSSDPVFSSDTSYYRFTGLPLYIPVDMGRVGSNIPSTASDTLIPATVVRMVETVNSPLRIGPDGTDLSDETSDEDALKIRMVNFDVSYEFQGKTHRSTIRTFRAPDN